jgi:Putative beta-barrel porin 2
VLKIWLSLSVSLLCFAQTAFAQTESGRKIGVFVSSQQVYEDNVLRQPKFFPVPRGFSRDDFRLSPSLNVDIIQPFGRQKLTLLGGVGYDFYRRNSRLERERINLQGRVDLAVGPDCTPQLGIAYARQQSDLADFFSFTNFRLRNREQRVSYSASVKCGSVIGLKPGLSIERNVVTNGSIFRRQGNFNSTAFGTSLGYISPTLGELSLFGNYRRGDYPNRGAFIGGRIVGDKVEVFSGGVRLQRDLGSRFKGNISLGYTIAEPSLPGTRRFSGGSGSADITAQLAEPLQVLIGYSRSVQQSNQLDVSFTVNDAYSLNASYVINPRLVLTAGASRTERKLRDSPALTPNLLGGKDQSTQYSTGLRFSPTGPISFSLSATKSSRKSESRFFDYDASAISFGVNLNI